MRAPFQRSCAGAALLAVACAPTQVSWSTAPSSAPSAKVVKPPRRISPARLLALPRDEGVGFSSTQPDGSRLLVVDDVRLIVRRDGVVEYAEELFPAGRAIVPLELPARLGGGWVFHTSGGSTTRIWRSEHWTGKLAPLARLGSDVRAVVAGFDRLYAVGESSGDLLALDARTGAVLDVGALPASPAFGAMAFADEWLAAVEADYRGVLITFDAGASWHPAGVRTVPPHVALEGDSLTLHTDVGVLELDASGRLSGRARSGSADLLFAPARPRLAPAGFAEAPGDRVVPGAVAGLLAGRLPLASAVLHGFPVDASTAVVAEGGALSRVRVSDGKVVSRIEGAYPGGECHAARVGSGIGFVCGKAQGATVVYELHANDSLRPVLSFDGPRYVAASDNGALVVRGPCQAAADANLARTYCIRSPSGELREVALRGDLGAERVVALDDGRAVVIVPPRGGVRGRLTIVARDGATKSVPLSLPKTLEEPARALLRKGLWLDGFVQEGRELKGWVAAAGPFVGVAVGLDGVVRVGAMQDDIDRTLVSGPFALAIGRPGLALETTNGGFDWAEVEVPPGLAERGGGLPAKGGARAREERGCSPVGCLAGTWLRVGWSDGKTQQPLASAPDPKPAASGLPRGGRWQFRCSSTGETAPHEGPTRSAAPATVRRPSPFARPPVRGVSPATASWLPFAGLAPPALAEDDARFDAGTDGHVARVRGYAWGPRGAEWSRTGRFLVRGVDRFVARGAVWSTLPSRSPWADAVAAGQRFGQHPSSTFPVSWAADFDASDRAGVLAMLTRGVPPELHLLEEDRAIVPVTLPGAWESQGIAGVAKTDRGWFIGASAGPRTFRVFVVENAEARLFHEYTRQPVGSSSVRLVRSARGDAVGLWVVDAQLHGAATSWYVFPLDARSGAAHAPLVLAPGTLGPTPAPCTSDEEGWVLVGRAPIEPYLDVVPERHGTGLHDVQVRLIASRRGLCVDALAARVDGDVRAAMTAAPLPSAPKASSPLIVASEGARTKLRCVH